MNVSTMTLSASQIERVREWIGELPDLGLLREFLNLEGHDQTLGIVALRKKFGSERVSAMANAVEIFRQHLGVMFPDLRSMILNELGTF